MRPKMAGALLIAAGETPPPAELPAGHPLVAKGHAEPADLAAETLITYPMERARLEKRSWEQDEAVWRRYLADWNSRKLSRITRQAVSSRA